MAKSEDYVNSKQYKSMHKQMAGADSSEGPMVKYGFQRGSVKSGYQTPDLAEALRSMKKIRQQFPEEKDIKMEAE